MIVRHVTAVVTCSVKTFTDETHRAYNPVDFFRSLPRKYCLLCAVMPTGVVHRRCLYT
jgi:hypothetical protein